MNITSIEKRESARVISFDDNGKILAISSTEPEDENTLFAYFDVSDVTKFMTGEEKLSDFLISKTKDVFTYELVKTRVHLQKRSKESQLHKIPYIKNSDIEITYDGKELTFIPSSVLMKASKVNSSQDVTVGGKYSHPFFITFDSKPEHLIETIQIPFAKLLSGPVSIKFEYNKYSISLYTQKFLEKYSFRRL